MSLWQHYIRPATLTEALHTLRDAPAPAALLAGGTDLLLDLQQGRHAHTATLIDIASVPELNRLELRKGSVFIGAAVPLARICNDALVLRHAEALVEACGLVGGPQVRNVATLGGNVAHGLPAADGTIALVALDAIAEVASIDGTLQVPILDLFRGPGQTSLDPHGQLIVGFVVPKKKSQEASAFRRIMRPQGVALPILNLGIWIRREGENVGQARVAFGPSGPVPIRAKAAEELLAGAPFSQTIISRAIDAVQSTLGFRTSPRRAGAGYRRQLVGPLLQEALEVAWSRTGQ